MAAETVHEKFQSTPGELTPSDSTDADVAAIWDEVSIHARRVNAERQPLLGLNTLRMKFQSTPGELTPSDILAICDHIPDLSRFNPRPAS